MDKRVTFQVGDLILEGRVWLATGSRDVGVVLCHPHPLHGGNMYSNVVSAVAEALWQHDVSTLRFNFRGTGASTGSHGGGEGVTLVCLAWRSFSHSIAAIRSASAREKAAP